MCGTYLVVIRSGIGSHWKTIAVGAIGIHEVDGWLVEVATRVVNLRNTGHDQTIGEVEVAINGTVVAGILDGPNALLAVLVLLFGTEVVVQVGFKSIAVVERCSSVFNHLLQVF